MSFKDYFDITYCINLDKRTDRWEQAQVEFKKIGISVRRVSAIDGSLYPEYAGLKPGANGCRLSHLKVLNMAIKNQYDKNDSNRVDSNSTMLDFLMSFVFKIIQNMDTGDKQTVIKNEIVCKADFLSIDYLKTALYSIDVRKELFNSGTEFAKEFLSLNHL